MKNTTLKTLPLVISKTKAIKKNLDAKSQIPVLLPTPINPNPINPPVEKLTFRDSIKLFFNTHPRINKLLESLKYLLVLFAGFAFIRKCFKYVKYGTFIWTFICGIILYYFDINIPELMNGWSRVITGLVVGLSGALVMLQSYLTETFGKIPTSPSIESKNSTVPSPSSSSVPSSIVKTQDFIINKENLISNLRKQYPNLSVAELDKIISLLKDIESKPTSSLEPELSIRKESIVLENKNTMWDNVKGYFNNHKVQYYLIVIIASTGAIYIISKNFDLYNVLFAGAASAIDRVKNLWSNSTLYSSDDESEEEPKTKSSKADGKRAESGPSSQGKASSSNNRATKFYDAISRETSDSNVSTPDRTFIDSLNLPAPRTTLNDSEFAEHLGKTNVLYTDFLKLENQIKSTKGDDLIKLYDIRSHIVNGLNQCNQLADYNRRLRVSTSGESTPLANPSSPVSPSSPLSPLSANGDHYFRAVSVPTSSTVDNTNSLNPLLGSTEDLKNSYRNAIKLFNITEGIISKKMVEEGAQAFIDNDNSKKIVNDIEEYFKKQGFTISYHKETDFIELKRINPYDQKCLVNEGVLFSLLSHFKTNKEEKSMIINIPSRITELKSSEISENDYNDMELLRSMCWT